eukprot:m.1019872 g.1019872  ORF g.1019872 m.1019872 type:complete len:316 (+) comp24087_c0_seq44:1782-2729(+)
MFMSYTHLICVHRCMCKVHRDDWLAQHNEELQTVSDLYQECRRHKFPPEGHRIYLLPLGAKGPDADSAPVTDLHAYMEAYFDSAVGLLPTIPLPAAPRAVSTHGKNKGIGAASFLGKKVRYRNFCAASSEDVSHGQFDAVDLLGALECAQCSGKLTVPDDAYAVLAVTMHDLFLDHDDIFTVGLAGRGVGVFSFYRYHPARNNFSTGSALSKLQQQQALLQRMTKTAVHEVLHMYSLGHCVVAHCCMNGSGHLREDFSVPHHLCALCLAKMKLVWGDTMDLRRRYAKLLAFYAAHMVWGSSLLKTNRNQTQGNLL